jgi:hypothetical protein
VTDIIDEIKELFSPKYRLKPRELFAARGRKKAKKGILVGAKFAMRRIFGVR